jgi:hypothetical protein
MMMLFCFFDLRSGPAQEDRELMLSGSADLPDPSFLSHIQTCLGQFPSP